MAPKTDPTIIVKPSPGLTVQQAHDLRARGLRYVLDRYLEKQKATGEHGGEDAKGGLKDDLHARRRTA